MPNTTPHLCRSALVALIAAALSCPMVARAQDAPSTQTTPTNTAPNATTQSSAQTSSDTSSAKSGKKAHKKQKHDREVNSKGNSKARVTQPGKDGQPDTDAARQNPNDRPSVPN